MKKNLLRAALMALSILFAPAATTLSVVSGLEFVPMVAVAPDDPPGTGGGDATHACVSPGAYKSVFFHCYTPAEMTAAYGVDLLHAEGTTGMGQTIVIVDSYGSPTALSDLQTFSTTFGLPAPDLTIVYPSGKPTYNNSMHGVEVGWAFETSLDLQWAHAIAPDAKLVLVAANPAETEGVQGFPSMFKGESYAIKHYPGSVFSQSFAVTEQSFQAAGSTQVALFDKVYKQAAAKHITVVSASGDSGTANVDKQGRVYPFPTAQWPASDPLVTGAGGTWLQSGWTWDPSVSADDFYTCLGGGSSFNTCAASYLSYTTGSGRTEAVWKEDWLPAAGGGALSVLFPTPSFQSGLPASLLNGKRGVPDISWNAAVDGGALVYTSFPGARVGWHIVGGTSAATPQIAGLVALVNQLRHGMGKNSIGDMNAALYALPASDFNDIVPQTFGSGAGVVTLDSNAEFASGIAGSATTAGYDLSTGLGSPQAYNFVHDLANSP